jgi:hypothetical protein
MDRQPPPKDDNQTARKLLWPLIGKAPGRIFGRQVAAG